MPHKPLFQKVYDLVKWVYTTVADFPRNQRLVLTQRIEITTIRILEMTIDFSNKDTIENKKKFLNEIHKLQILLRLCKDTSFLKFKQYEYASSLLTEISGLLDYQDSKLKTQDVGELANRGGGYWRPVEVVLSYVSTVFGLQQLVQRDLFIQEFGACIQKSEERQKEQKISPRF